MSAARRTSRGRFILLTTIALALSACGTIRGAERVIDDAPRDWRTVATENDRVRLRDWRSSWTKALAAVRAAGHGDDIQREGALLDPDAALGDGPIPSGTYRCRTIKLGARPPASRGYGVFSGSMCRVSRANGAQTFARLDGAQRPDGLLFPSDGLRQVFLGTLVLADEREAMRYGRDGKRDIAGVVERIGDKRWRLVMPAPHFESLLDVVELVPAE